MFEWMDSLWRRLSGAQARAQQEAEAKAWLDQLRRNELSMAARRQIAPDETVKAPGIGHGSVDAVPRAQFAADRFIESKAAASASAAEGGGFSMNPVDAMVESMLAGSSQTTAGDVSGGVGGEFGGAGSSSSFASEPGDGASADASSGDSTSGGDSGSSGSD